jgi:hypothetical protein
MKSVVSVAAALVVVTLGVVFTGCSDDDPANPGGSSTSGPRTVRVEEIRAALRPLADAECQWLYRCCNGDERSAKIGTRANAGECADHLIDVAVRSSIPFGLVSTGNSPAYTVLQELNRLGYGFDRGRIAVDKAAVDACVQRVNTSTCTPAAAPDHCTPVPPPPIDDPCKVKRLLVGKQQLGEDCSPGSTDCANGLLCSTLRGSDGVCVKAAAPGDACFDDSDCNDELVCDFRSGKCVQGGDAGASCSYSDPERPREGTTADRCRRELSCDTVTLKCGGSECAGGSFCIEDAQCPAGATCVRNRCGKLLKAGEPCGQDRDCESASCRFQNGRLSCGSLGPVGSACQDDRECASGYCTFTAGVPGQKCTAQLADAADCNSDRECVSGRCRPSAAGGLVCAPAVAPGATCDADDDCSPVKKLFCFQTKCTLAPLPDGASCNVETDCTSELCFNAKCTPKSVAGADCNKADVPPCDDAFYCDSVTAAPGKCVAKRGYGARCVRDEECAGSCIGMFGTLRCNGAPRGSTICSSGGP